MRIRTVYVISIMALVFASISVSIDTDAYAEPTLSLTSSNIDESKVAIDLSIENNPGVWGLSVKVTYDSVFKLESVTNGNLFQITPGTLTKNPYTVYGESADFDNVTGNGNIVTMRFLVADDAPAGDYHIRISQVEAFNVDGDDVYFDTVDATVTVGSVPPAPPVPSKTVTLTVVYNDGETKVFKMDRGSRLTETKPVYKYYRDEAMTETWSPLTKVNHDTVVYAAVVQSGPAGPGTVWSLDFSTGTLTISGDGATDDWAAKTTPWYAYKGYITSLQVDEGVTYLGAYACYKYPSLNDIVLPDSLVGTGKYCIVTSVADHVKVGSGLRDLGMRGLFGMEFHEGSDIIDAKDYNLRAREFYGADGKVYLETISGVAADTVWSIDYCTKTLTISGNGSAGNWGATTAPWYLYRTYFENVVVEDGVTEVGDFSFYSYTSIVSVNLGKDVARIGTNALRGCGSLQEISFGDGLTTIGSNALLGYTFAVDGKTVKATAPNLKGHTFTGPGDKTFVCSD